MSTCVPGYQLIQNVCWKISIYMDPNELKVTLCVHQTCLYKVILAFVLDVLLFGSSRAPKSGEIIVMSAMLVLTWCRK